MTRRRLFLCCVVTTLAVGACSSGGGGNGKSGNGSRQSGIWVLDQFTRWQSMNWDYAGKLQKAQMDVADVDADLSFRLPD